MWGVASLQLVLGGGESMTELEFMDIFAGNLADRMKEFDPDYSQADVAFDAYLDKSTISRYLKGTQMPSVRALVNLCVALDCEITDLIPDYEIIN